MESCIRFQWTPALAVVLFLPMLGAAGPADKPVFPSDLAPPDLSAAPVAGIDSAETIPSLDPSILPSPPLVSPALSVSERPEAGVNWNGLLWQSSMFLGIEHGFRLWTESGTRQGLQGSFLHNYFNALGNLHGWADGDPFYVNYVGHPMQGAVAGYLWVQNDHPAYRLAEFGRNRTYWKSRLRATAYAWAYSEQFEIGPLSEASLGGIQAFSTQQGFVDHVITPTFGLGWMIAEDALDKYVIKRVENHTESIWIRLLLRSWLNPSRSFANVMAGNLPWHRDTRPGIYAYSPNEERWLASMNLVNASARGLGSEIPDVAGPAPFEFSMAFQPERLSGGGKGMLCLGGGAEGAFRMGPAWQMVLDVAGCKMTGLEENLSGDALTYMIGPRWNSRSTGPWSAHLELLLGGAKLTEERMFPDQKQFLVQAALRNGTPPPAHEEYTTQTESHGFAVAAGGGVDYKLNRALAIRVADLSYRYAWIDPLWGANYSHSLKLTSGLVFRVGTW